MDKFCYLVAMIAMAVPGITHAQSEQDAAALLAGERVGALGQSVSRPPAPEGEVPRLPDGRPDLNGLWIGGGAVQDMSTSLKEGEEILMLPEAQAVKDARTAADNPQYWCLPMGVARTTPYPFRIIQNYTHQAETHIFLLHEGNIHSYRQIFMDGREHPDDLDPTWYGHSIGWWEGDTLVVDTIGYNGKAWYDNQGYPATERLHSIERWTRTSLGELVREVTIDDPGAYEKPFTLEFTARLAQPGDELMEYICQENNQFGIAGGYANPYSQ
ncbi:MAG TPA: hypothetical protein VIV14_10305 [Gammaproteobacteria bacterium]